MELSDAVDYRFLANTRPIAAIVISNRYLISGICCDLLYNKVTSVMGFILFTPMSWRTVQIMRSKWWKKGLFGPDFNKKYSELLYITASFISYITDSKNQSSLFSISSIIAIIALYESFITPVG